MTINLLQLDKRGKESITPIFASPEDRQYMQWLLSLEEAAPGTTIFVHRLSELGHYLCTVPCPYSRFIALDPDHPLRYCGCPICIDTRKYINDYVARVIIMDMQNLITPELAAEFSTGDKSAVEWC